MHCWSGGWQCGFEQPAFSSVKACSKFQIQLFFKRWRQLSYSCESAVDSCWMVHQGPHNRFVSLILQPNLQQDMSVRHVQDNFAQDARVHTHHYQRFMNHMWNGRFSGSLPAWVMDIRFRVKLWAIRSNLFRWCQSISPNIQKKRKQKKKKVKAKVCIRTQRASAGFDLREPSLSSRLHELSEACNHLGGSSSAVLASIRHCRRLHLLREACNHSGGPSSAVLASLRLQRWWRVHRRQRQLRAAVVVLQCAVRQWMAREELLFRETVHATGWEQEGLTQQVLSFQQMVAILQTNFEQVSPATLRLLIREWRFSSYASTSNQQSVGVQYGPEEEIVDAYPSGVTDTSHSRQFRVSVAFLSGVSLMIGWDTCSMVDLIDPDYLHSGITWISDKKTAVRGLGGAISHTEGTVRLETLSLAVGGHCRDHPVKVLKPPRGVAILFGIPSILQMMAIMALHRERIFLEDHKEWVHVDLLQRTMGRMSMEGVCALSSCDGMATPTIVLRELGIPIKEYRAVESNAKIREIARSVYPGIVHIPPHDVNKVRHECVTGNCSDGTPFIVTLFFGSPICVPWSGARQNPGGYNEQEAKTFTSTGKLREICLEQNPKCASFIENVKLHPAVADQGERQEKEIGLSMEPSNVADNQSSNSRPRRLATDMAEYSTAAVRKHLCPAWLLDGDFFPMQHPMPCLVARGDDTHMPVVLVSAWNNEQRFATADEKDRMQGYCTGITHGFFNAKGDPCVLVELSLRVRLTGNCFNYEHIYLALQAWSDSVVNKPAYCLSVIDDDRRDYDKFELFLTNMSHEQKVT